MKTRFSPRDAKCEDCRQVRSLRDGLCHECEQRHRDEDVIWCDGEACTPGGYAL